MDLATQIADVFTCVHQSQDGHADSELADCARRIGAVLVDAGMCSHICDSCESIRLTTAAARDAVNRGFRRPEASATMQVRIVRANQRSYFYFPDVSAKRAAELAADACAAQCIDDVEYLEIFDGAQYDGFGDDVAPVLVADWQGRPAITLRMEISV